MNAVRQLFAKKPAAPAAVKRPRKGVTAAKLNAAIAAACADLDRTSETYRTLQGLYDLTDKAADGDIITPSGQAPVTVAELDAAFAEVEPGPALKRVRLLLAQAEENGVANVRAQPVQHVTVAQLKAHDTALFDAFSWALGAISSELNRSQPSQARALELLNRSASSPERKKLLAGIREFREADVPKMTPEEWLRYQARGPR